MPRDPDVRRFFLAGAFFACCVALVGGLAIVGLWH